MLVVRVIPLAIAALGLRPAHVIRKFVSSRRSSNAGSEGNLLLGDEQRGTQFRPCGTPDNAADSECLASRSSPPNIEVPRSPFAAEGERGTANTYPASEAASVAQRQQRP